MWVWSSQAICKMVPDLHPAFLLSAKQTRTFSWQMTLMPYIQWYLNFFVFVKFTIKFRLEMAVHSYLHYLNVCSVWPNMLNFWRPVENISFTSTHSVYLQIVIGSNSITALLYVNVFIGLARCSTEKESFVSMLSSSTISKQIISKCKKTCSFNIGCKECVWGCVYVWWLMDDIKSWFY